jgi:regulator of sirC expression with transglutaminase-like and TPR domain
VDAGVRFAALVTAPDGEVSLAETALTLAADEYPDLDMAACLRRLDALGRLARERVVGGMGADAAAGALNTLLFLEEGFRGNREDYYDPRNSFLNDVLDRRLGIPITLSIVYIEVAARAGVTVRGIGLPGHFVVRLEHGGAARLLDPFDAGTILSEADCHTLVRRVHGAGVPFDPAYMAPVTTRQILARMLLNLKAIYARQQDWPRALRVMDRLLVLTPGAVGEIRDRGLIRAQIGARPAAIRDLERYLREAPEAPDARGVRARLRALRLAQATLN